MRNLDQYLKEQIGYTKDCFTVVFTFDEYADLSWLEPAELVEMEDKLKRGVAENLVALCFNNVSNELVDSIGGILVDWSDRKSAKDYLDSLANDLINENFKEPIQFERD